MVCTYYKVLAIWVVFLLSFFILEILEKWIKASVFSLDSFLSFREIRKVPLPLETKAMLMNLLSLFWFHFHFVAQRKCKLSVL